MPGEQDVEFVRRAFAAWNAGDHEAMLEMVHPDLLFFPLRSQLDGAAYSGRAGVRQFAADAAEKWEHLRIVPDEFRAVGEFVLMLGRFDARGRGSGIDIEFPCGWVARTRDGMVAYLRTYSDPQEALKAVGVGARALSQAGFDGDLDSRFCPGESRGSIDVINTEAVPGGVA